MHDYLGPYGLGNSKLYYALELLVDSSMRLVSKSGSAGLIDK